MGNRKNSNLDSFKWFFAITLGAVPIMMAIAPMSFSPRADNWQIFVRGNSLVVPVIEFAIVLFAMAKGGSVLRGFKSLPLISRVGIIAWIPVLVYTAYQPGNDLVYANIGIFKLFILSIFISVSIDLYKNISEHGLFSVWLSIGIGIQIYFIIFIFYILINDINGEQWISNYPGFNNIRHICVIGFVSYFTGMYLYIFNYSKNRFNNLYIFYIIFGLSGLSLAFWTGTRATVLSCIVLTLIATIFVKEKGPDIIRYALFVFVLSLILVSPLPLPHPAYGILAAFGISDLNAPTLDGASSGRIELWIGTIQKILEKPIWGWGIEQYSRFNPVGDYTIFHPHNFPLQFIFATGIFGFVIAVIVVTPIILQQMRTSSEAIRRFQFAMLATLGVYALFDGILYFSYSSLIFAVLLISCWRQPPVPDRSG